MPLLFCALRAKPLSHLFNGYPSVLLLFTILIGFQIRGSELLQLLQSPVHARLHAAAFRRSSAISSKERPSPSSVAFLQASVCQRCVITSTYFGSSSMP
jgi:hypothetical protein